MEEISPLVRKAGRARPRVVLACEHASAQFGGEAAIPLHYFRTLRNKGVDVWLVTHARTRDELMRLFPGESRIIFIVDSRLHRALWQVTRRLPAGFAYFTSGYVSRLSVQWRQRRIIRQLVRDQDIDIVHQPIPVSPREPSMLFDLGAPVIIGPMNGGMDYPPAFRRHRPILGRALLALGRMSAGTLNRLIPGKRRAALLLVANHRTRLALPSLDRVPVRELVENGVDMTIWHGDPKRSDSPPPAVTTFTFIGRLVAWKAVDLLLHAFGAASVKAPMRLLIIGDGPEAKPLRALAVNLGILAADLPHTGRVSFAGWLSQRECAERLDQADVLVLPSLLECGGAVVLEAMSLAKPVIATAWGGPVDYIDESCGILVEARGRDDVIRGFADAMHRLSLSPELRVRLGNSGRQKILDQYDWDKKADQMLEFYKLAIAAADV